MASRTFAAVAAILLVSGNLAWAQTAPTADAPDPPTRVGRLSAIEGTVQQRTADNADWAPAGLNYPVTDGFALATQDGGRAEIEVGSLTLRVGAASELDVNNLGERNATFTVPQGEINLRLGRLADGDRVQVVTPRGVIDILQAGRYHVDAGTTESPTQVAVMAGHAQVERNGAPVDVGVNQAALLSGDPSGNLSVSMAQASVDPLDTWAASRDRPSAPQPAVASAPPVPPEMTGAADLDAYGRWSTDPNYGSVWYPSAVPAGWAPYQYGHWAWVSPWGWTWIDDAPWGFAPFHYGRWAFIGGGWGWVPGVYIERPVYAPALVAFFGGPGFSVGVGFEGVGWCPLGPHEIFAPWYRSSIAYVRNVNIAHVSNINVMNFRRDGDGWAFDRNRDFANRRFATAVSARDFAGGRPVHQVAAHSAALTSASLPVAHGGPGVAPPAGARGTLSHVSAGRPILPTTRPPHTGSASNAGAGVATSAASRTGNFAGTHHLPTLRSGRGMAPTAAAPPLGHGAIPPGSHANAATVSPRGFAPSQSKLPVANSQRLPTLSGRQTSAGAGNTNRFGGSATAGTNFAKPKSAPQPMAQPFNNRGVTRTIQTPASHANASAPRQVFSRAGVPSAPARGGRGNAAIPVNHTPEQMRVVPHGSGGDGGNRAHAGGNAPQAKVAHNASDKSKNDNRTR